MKTVYLFPGQGSQFVGMGTEHFRRRPIILQTVAEVEKITGIALQRVMKAGPRRELQGTHVAQLAIFAISVAVLRAVQDDTWYQPDIVCGHSLGQFSALVAAGVLDLETGARLVDQRGRLMDRQNQLHSGGMLAVSGMTQDVLTQYLRDYGSIWLANDNAPGQLIASGDKGELERLQARLKADGRPVVSLDVAGAYHSPLLAPAAEAFADYLETLVFQNPVCPVIANTDASLMTCADQVRKELAGHMLAPVAWQQTMRRIRQLGIETGVEIGAGRTMKGLWLRNHPDLHCLTSNDTRDLTATLKCLREMSEQKAQMA